MKVLYLLKSFTFVTHTHTHTHTPVIAYLANNAENHITISIFPFFPEANPSLIITNKVRTNIEN